jgi:hypothetical protein
MRKANGSDVVDNGAAIRLSKEWSQMPVIEFLRVFNKAGLTMYARAAEYGLGPGDVVILANEAMFSAPPRPRNRRSSKGTKRKASGTRRKNP